VPGERRPPQSLPHPARKKNHHWHRDRDGPSQQAKDSFNLKFMLRGGGGTSAGPGVRLTRKVTPVVPVREQDTATAAQPAPTRTPPAPAVRGRAGLDAEAARPPSRARPTAEPGGAASGVEWGDPAPGPRPRDAVRAREGEGLRTTGRMRPTDPAGRAT
jgi:hypothetical protein